MESTMIPYGRQQILQQDIEAILQVLQSDWLTQGPAVSAFETDTARYCGAKYAVGVSSATAALHLACLAAGVGPGDRVWTSPNTFVASANCALYCGATVDFVDICPRTFNLSVEHLEAKLEAAARSGTLPKVLIVVHFGGLPCDMEKIAQCAKKYGVLIIEDASHAIGSKYQHAMTGSGAYSAMTVFSFHPVKVITSGEGGMIATNSAELYERLTRLRAHGITRDPKIMTAKDPGPWYYEQVELGFNYRISDLHAALGRSQLKRIDHFLATRNLLARNYRELLGHLPLELQYVPADRYSAYHIFVVKLVAHNGKKPDRRRVFDELRAQGIGVQVHYIPVPLQPYFRKLGFRPGMFPNAETYYDSALTLPLFVDLDPQEQTRIASILAKILECSLSV